MGNRGTVVRWGCALSCLLVPLTAWAVGEHGTSEHASPVILLLFELVVILLAAKLGGDVMVRLRQPEVLGELVIGIVLGNLILFGIPTFSFLRQDEMLAVLSELGVVLLLFEVGLHTTLPDMMKVGISAFFVAVLGVIAPRGSPRTGSDNHGADLFFTMGARVNVTDFARVELLGFAACLTLAAIVGKQICGVGAREVGLDRIAVGLGMIPRGEVGLIFASIGANLMLHGQPLIDSATYGVVVIMVVLTTLVTPPLITWRFRKLGATNTGAP